ncbi:MAG: hypothetical protein GQ470_07200, partial [Gammaproteobacteria bacterium]|nr:hypothetical protein [Gammaproteobacteria bacterium]
MSFLHRLISTVQEVKPVSNAERLLVPQTSTAPRRILVVNSKGGCGKTTISTNLAGCLSSR